MIFKNNDESIALYANEKGKLFLRIRDSVADYACFILERNVDIEKKEVKLTYFQEKVEYLVEKCKLHNQYNNLKIDVQVVEDSDTNFFIGKDIYLGVDDENIIMQVGEETLQLITIEEVMGLNVSFMFVSTTQCRDDENALLYIFANEKYKAMIMERSDNKSFIKVFFEEHGDANLYVCSDE